MLKIPLILDLGSVLLTVRKKPFSPSYIIIDLAYYLYIDNGIEYGTGVANTKATAREIAARATLDIMNKKKN